KPVQPDIPMWIGGGSKAAIRRTARYGTGWSAGLGTPEELRAIVSEIAATAQSFGRTIDEDHYGTGITFHIGAPDDPTALSAAESFRRRYGRDPRDSHAFGDAEHLLGRISAYIDAGISKFILIPLSQGDDAVLEQTRLVIEQVLPEAAKRWPKPPRD
ncbi:MAG: LLM class flavin-dependent oxidoreductase, partial [Caulobacterales bacterium]